MDNDLLSILACPKCQHNLSLDASQQGLTCASCQLVFPIIEEVPVLLQEEAIPLTNWERGERPAATIKSS